MCQKEVLGLPLHQTARQQGRGAPLRRLTQHWGPQPHNQRMFRALFSSSSPLAAFLVDTCEATANFANDFIDLPILESYYRMWLGFKWRRAQFVQKEEATAAAAQNAAVLAGADVTSAAQAAAVARDRFLVTEVLGLPDPLAVAANVMYRRLCVLLGLSQEQLAAQTIAAKELDGWGLKLQEEDVHALHGLIVNQGDLDDDPEDAHPLLWLGLMAGNVALHTVCIWALVLPLLAAVVVVQEQMQSTTG
ncbi:uncharacterized protein HaLaN_24584, partial [Haematococcus lacustris]